MNHCYRTELGLVDLLSVQGEDLPPAAKTRGTLVAYLPEGVSILLRGS